MNTERLFSLSFQFTILKYSERKCSLTLISSYVCLMISFLNTARNVPFKNIIHKIV